MNRQAACTDYELEVSKTACLHTQSLDHIYFYALEACYYREKFRMSRYKHSS